MPKQATHTFIGRIPELRYVLLRDERTCALELWTESKGVCARTTQVQGIELEFVREARSACKVLDNEFNRTHCPDDIGRIYVDGAPGRALVKELK